MELLLSYAVGALGKKANAEGGLGGGLGSLAGLLGGDDGKFGVDDVKDLGGRFL